MTLVSTNDPHHPKMKKAKVDEEACLGCGVCLRTCSHDGLSLRSRPQRVITPVNSVHRVVMMAIERGDLQNLIFDNRVLWNHRALAAVMGVDLAPASHQASPGESTSEIALFGISGNSHSELNRISCALPSRRTPSPFSREASPKGERNGRDRVGSTYFMTCFTCKQTALIASAVCFIQQTFTAKR